MPANAIPFIDVTQAAQLWETRPDGVILLDVREPFELQLAAIAGATHIPLHTVPDQLHVLTGASQVLCLCHHGMRSAAAAQWLIQNGVNAVNVQGGIDAWSLRVSADIARY
jgi:adenylyltransferase/sulfurtransferase